MRLYLPSGDCWYYSKTDSVRKLEPYQKNVLFTDHSQKTNVQWNLGATSHKRLTKQMPFRPSTHDVVIVASFFGGHSHNSVGIHAAVLVLSLVPCICVHYCTSLFLKLEYSSSEVHQQKFHNGFKTTRQPAV